MNENELVIEALKKVPEKRLLIMDLVWQVLDDNGQMDFTRVVDKQPEVNLALAEANAYAQATQRAWMGLIKLLEGRS